MFPQFSNATMHLDFYSKTMLDSVSSNLVLYLNIIKYILLTLVAMGLDVRIAKYFLFSYSITCLQTNNSKQNNHISGCFFFSLSCS